MIYAAKHKHRYVAVFIPDSHTISKDAETWTHFVKGYICNEKLFFISTSAWLTCLCNIPAEDLDQAYYKTQMDRPVLYQKVTFIIFTRN